MSLPTQIYKFPFYDMAGKQIEITLHYQDPTDIDRVFMEDVDITEILDNDYLSELLYDALYEYEQAERESW